MVDLWEDAVSLNFYLFIAAAAIKSVSKKKKEESINASLYFGTTFWVNWKIFRQSLLFSTFYSMNVLLFFFYVEISPSHSICPSVSDSFTAGKKDV